MAMSLADVLRHVFGGDKKEKSVFRTEREAYDFCRQAYRQTGGVTPELRRSYEFYQKNMDDGCDPEFKLPAAHHS